MQQRLGRFEILKRLGEGAMGEVYLGLDPAIGRQVAIKTIHREAAMGAEARERFAREARAAGTLNHPNLVTIHEFGEDQGLLYLAMEFVPGVDLEAMLRDRVLPPVDVLEVLAQVCDGLAYAHQKGVLHRDIKPSNIRVRREGDQLQAKVMDFGIARIVGSELTGTGTLLGTFGYMAPEYIKTGVLDPRCDLFAVGVILYEALGGHRPFTGEATATVLYQVVNEDPAPLAPNDFHGISPKTSLLLAKALAKDPDKRFQSAEALAKALRDAKDRAWVGPPGVAPTRDSVRPPVLRSPAAPTRSSKAWPWLAATLILGGLGTGGWLWWQKQTAPRVITLDSVPPMEGASAAPPSVEPSQEAGRAIKAGASNPPSSKGPLKHVPVPAKQPPLPEEEVPGLLNEAAKGLMDQPQGSLDLCDRVLRDHPANPRAYALKVVALYGLGRYQDMPGVLSVGKAQGVMPAQYLAYGHFTAMLREERRDHRLPANVREALAEAMHLGQGRLGQGALSQRIQRPSRD